MRERSYVESVLRATPCVGKAPVLCLALVFLAACSGATAKGRPAIPTLAALPPATTTTVAPGPVFPLTGLPASGATAARPAVSVKIDNVDPGRPQSGVNDADIVFEELVEGGNSRLFAVYQSHDSAFVGPVRSARPVDADLLHALGGGIFAYSGAAAGEIAPVKDHSGAVLMSEEIGSPGFARDHRRDAPYNLYTSTPALYAAAGGHASPPPPFFTYDTRPSGAPARGADLPFAKRISSNWRWNAASQLFERTQNGSPDVLQDGSLVTAADVVIMSVEIRGTGIFDTVHEEDPLVVVVGTGPCWVLRNGRVIEGRWDRPTLDSPTRLVTAAGAPIALQPGRSWVELLPNAAHPQFP
ncbi:MAG: DUF3048 domain-containing protein [Acidimicrobiales bacterium]